LPGPSNYEASDGAAYERFIGRWSRRVADRLPEYLEPLSDGPLLDVGTGTGSVAVALKEHYRDRGVLGIDVARPYLDFAAARQDAAGIEFAVGDACNLDGIEDDRFAASVALIVLNFVSDPQAAALEMKRVTRPGGKVLLSGWDFRGGLVYQRLLWDTASVLDPAAAERRDRIFSGPLALPDGMVDLLNGAGLDEVTREWVTIRMDFADFDDYWQPLLGGQGPVGGYVAGLEPGKRPEIEEAVRRAFLCGAPDGPRSLTATAWVVSGIVP
jgi:SAM-dependent methyltransferase